MPPKAKAPAPPEEFDPASLLPPDLPDQSPFPLAWQPVVAVACLPAEVAGPGHSETYVRLLNKTNEHITAVCMSDVISRLDAAHPVAQEIAAAQQAHMAQFKNLDGFGLSLELQVKALNARFERDGATAWKFELVRRQAALQSAESEVKVADADLAIRASHLEEARAAHDAAVELLPKQDALELDDEPSVGHFGNTDPTATSGESTLQTSDRVGGDSRTPPEPAAEHSFQAAVDEAAEQLHAAQQVHAAAAATLAAASQKLEAAQANLNAPWKFYQPYLVHGLCSSLEQASALLDLDVPLRTVLWVHSDAPAAEPELVTAVRAYAAAGVWGSKQGSVAVVEVPYLTPPPPPVIEPPPTTPDPAVKGRDPKKAEKKKEEEPPPEPDPQLDLHGMKELATALLETHNLAFKYDKWRSDAKVWELDAVEVPSMAYYDYLLSTVPPERTSVGIVMHAMLEQVSRNSQGDDVVAEVEAARATSLAMLAIENAFQSYHLPTEDGVFLNQRTTRPDYTLVHEGDDVAAAAAGFTTGFIQQLPQGCTSPTSVLERVSRGQSETDSFTRGPVGGVDVDSVEAHMATLLPLPGWQERGFPAVPEMDPVEVSLYKTALKANCKEVSLGAVERFLLLKSFCETLPEGVREAHAHEVMARRHVEELSPSILPQTLGRAILDYPQHATHYYAADDALLVALFAGLSEGPVPPAVPCAFTFAQVHERQLHNGSADTDLASTVYHILPTRAALSAPPRYLYPQDGTILSNSSTAPLLLRKGSTVVGLASQDEPGLLATVESGAVVFAQAEASAAGDGVAVSWVQCCTPEGTVIELSSDGMVAMFPRDVNTTKAPYIRGVDVRGAPIPGCDLDAVARLGRERCQAVLPDGSLVLKSREQGLRVLHPDGAISEQIEQELPGDEGEGPLKVTTWVRTAQEGQRWRLIPAKQAASQPAHAAAEGEAAAPTDAVVGAGGAQDDTAAEAGQDESEEEQEEMWEVLEPVAAATVTDADTLAKVTTREDLVMAIRYPGGEQLLMEPLGRRVTRTTAGWLVESEGLPAVEGNQKGVTVQPCPGVKLSWNASTQVISVALNDGSRITVANGAACFSLTGKEVDAFLEAAAELPPARSAEPEADGGEQIHGRAVQLSRWSGCEGCLVADLVAGAAAFWESEEVHAAVGPHGQGLLWPATAAPPPEPEALRAEGPATVQSPVPPSQFGSRPASPAVASPRISQSLELGAFSLDQLGADLHPEGQAGEGQDGTAKQADEQPQLPPREVQPLAPKVKPRLFVVYRSGDGLEILAGEHFKAYLAEHRPTPARQYVSCQVCEMPGSTEPGTVSYQFSTQHQPVSRSLSDLAIGPASTLHAYDPDKADMMPALRRPSTVVAAQPAQGLTAPRVTALWPPAPHKPAPLAVVSLREMTEHPAWSPADLAKLEDAVANWQRQREEERVKMSHGSILHPDERTEEVQAGDGSVLAAILASRKRRIEAGQEVVNELQRVLDRQQGLQDAQEAEEAALVASRAATSEKKLRPRPRKHVPFEHTPKRPSASPSMGYWETQEGLEALQQDSLLRDGSTITRKTLPTRASPPAAATPGRLGMPGVYLSARTQVLDDGPAVGSQHQDSVTSSFQRDGSGLHQAQRQGSSTPTGRRPQPLAPVDYSYPELGYRSLSATSTLPPTVTQRTVAYDIYGQPRQGISPNLPPLYYAEEAPSVMNEHHIQAEGAVLSGTRTSSTSLMRAQGKGLRQFILTPHHLHLGTLPVGAVVHRPARLQNVGTQRARFSVSRPEPPLRVIYKPGPLAAGVDAVLTVEFVAERPGDFVGEVVVKTELNVLTLTVSAKVVDAGEAQTDQ